MLLKKKMFGRRTSVARKVVPKQRISKPRRRTLFDVNVSEVFEDMVDSLRRSISRPEVISLILLASAICIAYKDGYGNGPVGEWITSHKVNNTFAKWLDINRLKFFGLMVFSPSVFDLPSKSRLFIAFGVFAWVVLIPEHTVYEYIVQSFALHTFFKARKVVTRIALIGVFFLAWFFGWVALNAEGKIQINYPVSVNSSTKQ